MKKKFFFLLFTLTLFLIPVSIFGWNDTGHRVIASIAYDRLSPSAKHEVDQLTAKMFPYGNGYHRFLKAATWPDDIRQADFILFNSWHFINYPYSDQAAPTSSASQTNIIDVLQQSIQLLTTQAHNNPKNLYLKTLMLSLLIHMSADAHQPLHCINRFSSIPVGFQEAGEARAKSSSGAYIKYVSSEISTQQSQNLKGDGYIFPEGDKGGNLYTIQGEKAPDLHAFWDQGLGIFNHSHMNYRLYDQWVSHLANFFSKKYPPAAFKDQLRDLNPEDWTRESYRLAIDVAYQTPFNQKPSPEYIKQSKKIVGQQCALAGYRLAALLNKIFSNAHLSN